MTKISTILFFCMIFDAGFADAQRISLKLPTNKDSNRSPLSLSGYKEVESLPLALIPANFYSSNLGFFCKKEWKIESATKIPFRFRLGTVGYNDWLEGKPNTSPGLYR